MGLTGLEIFKYTPAFKKLPKTNCKECGCTTCMIYSLKLAKQQIKPEACPYIEENFIDVYYQNQKHAQKTIQIGNLKIGGENVLYRHEKTFNNPTALAVMVDCKRPDYRDKIQQIKDFKTTRVDKEYNIDLIVLINNENVPVSENIISYEDLTKYDIDIIQEKDFQSTKNYLITSRYKAILEKDDKYSSAVCVIMKNDNLYSQCARASYYICKYANMIIFPEFDESLFKTIITLRQNIYTDPNKTLQVNSGLYEFNSPNKNSIVFMTTNFALTYYAVASELSSLQVPSYLIVIPADGMSVLTAWSAEKFNPDIVKETIEKLDIKNKINTRKIIIPGLLSDVTEELHTKCPDFEFIEGTKEASDIGNFVNNLLAK